MRILVVKNKRYRSDYLTCIYTLLEEIGRTQGYDISNSEHIKDELIKDNFVHFVTLPPASSITRFIQQQQLAAFIRKNKIDLLVQHAGDHVKQKRIPQLLIADDVEKLLPVSKIKLPNISLLTYSQAAKQIITEKGFTQTVQVVPFFADALYQPINWSMKQQVKIDHTEGREYFYAPHHFKSIEEIMMFLKAFSGFKNWQRSSMKLVLAGKLYVPPADWEEKISTYRFREDVIVYNHTEAEKARLLAGAYACIHLPQKDNDLLPLLQTMQCETPVTSFDLPSVKEYAADAAFTTAPGNFDDLTQQMILMYKDENQRNKLIENCSLQAKEYSKEAAMSMLQALIAW